MTGCRIISCSALDRQAVLTTRQKADRRKFSRANETEIRDSDFVNTRSGWNFVMFPLKGGVGGGNILSNPGPDNPIV